MPEYYKNFNLTDIITPVKADVFEKLLIDSSYDADETKFVVQGFRYGFDIQYNGPMIRQSTAKNLPITVGSKTQLWNKIMKEVKNKRVAGPYK